LWGKGGIGLRPFALLVAVGGFDGTRPGRRGSACEYVPELVVLFVFLGCFQLVSSGKTFRQAERLAGRTNVGILFDVVAARLLARVRTRPVALPFFQFGSQLQRLFLVGRPGLIIHRLVRH
jgi:hypothetical protein